ncbi:PAC2 family protein [Nitriliruptor alkaliphilus]|uniref:PAC2 family protein n=1 Tax=Nitriliruptor alkaliphilus TaxID=427918 RepID=UPI000698C289|nr:PAC2 family protein [Nitriliruptor alkaliphilus]
MRLLRLAADLPDAGPDPVIVVALDGWTDAGAAGTTAAELLLDQFEVTELGVFDPDALFDYRDRRPVLEIDRGQLGVPRWPELHVDLVTPPAGPKLVVVGGAEPDLRWRAVADDLIELAEALGVGRYVGLGSIPGPIPHTRPVQLISTSSDTDLLARFGRPHEQVVVPASCQVAIEAQLRTAGLTTLGLWARLPHYVATDYPAASKALLERLSAYTGTPVDVSGFEDAIEEQRVQLDEAAAASEEITEHVRGLEAMYDAVLEAERQQQLDAEPGPLQGMTPEQVPSGDEIAAEVERFLRGRAD